MYKQKPAWVLNPIPSILGVEVSEITILQYFLPLSHVILTTLYEKTHIHLDFFRNGALSKSENWT